MAMAASRISVSNPPDSSKEDNSGKPDEDEVHARIMAKLDELENEEIEDGSPSGSDEDAEDSFQSNVDDDKNEASEIADLSMQFSVKDHMPLIADVVLRRERKK
ncbi:hypothetical protein COCNU_scaffold000264G000010 [Cocos nucifera]|nr:hypothetical protein [Cocos nucifera]